MANPEQSPVHGHGMTSQPKGIAPPSQPENPSEGRSIPPPKIGRQRKREKPVAQDPPDRVPFANHYSLLRTITRSAPVRETQEKTVPVLPYQEAAAVSGYITVHLLGAATSETLEGTERSKRVRLAEGMRKRSRSLISDGDLRKAEGFNAQDVVRRNDARRRGR